MNTKSYFTSALALTALVATSSASSLIAGWDFTNGSGTSVAATHSYKGDGATASTVGTFYLDGTNGSSSFTTNGALGDFQYTSGGNLGNQTIDFLDGRFVGINSQLGTTPVRSLQFQDGVLSGAPNGKSVVFGVQGGADVFQDIQFSYASSVTNNGQSGDINWSYSTGGGFTSIAGTDSPSVTLASGGTEQLYSIAGVSSSTLFIRATFSNIADDGSSLQIDNFQIGGTVVPEPSTYAALAGVMALMFVALRRRV